MNQNQPPVGHAAPPLSPTSDQLSIAGVISLICAVLSMCTSLICCAGLLPGGLAVVLGIFAIMEHRNGKANQLSAILGGVGAALGALAVVVYGAMMALGIGAGLMDGMSQDAPFEMPAIEEFQETKSY